MLQPYIGQHAAAEARGVGLAFKHHDRHPHPNRVARGRVPGKRKRIETNVGLLDQLQVFPHGTLIEDFHPIRLDTFGSNRLVQLSRYLGRAIGQHQQPRPRDPLQDLPPGLEHRGGDFGKTVERSECHATRRACGQGRDRRRLVGWPITEKAARQPDQLLGVEWFGHARRIGPVVGQPIVHRRHAGRVLVSQVGHLDWRRLAGENQQAMSVNVAGQIDQDVNPILAHRVGD